MGQTLVVAAYPPELGDLVADVVETASVGIGAVDASISMGALLASVRPARVIVVGTCGAFAADGAPEIGTCVVVRRARWDDGGHGIEVPEVVVREARADETLAGRIAAAAEVPLVDASCSAGVTVDAERAATPSAGALVEHMEVFAIYRACELAGIPAAALLAVANRVGPGARSEWRQNAATAEGIAVETLRKVLPLLGAA